MLSNSGRHVIALGVLSVDLQCKKIYFKVIAFLGMLMIYAYVIRLNPVDTLNAFKCKNRV